MGSRNQGDTEIVYRTYPPIYLKDYSEDSYDIWGEFSTILERYFFEVGQLHRPSETPLVGQKCLSEGKKL